MLTCRAKQRELHLVSWNLDDLSPMRRVLFHTSKPEKCVLRTWHGDGALVLQSLRVDLDGRHGVVA